jgi:hypothetical protein
LWQVNGLLGFLRQGLYDGEGWGILELLIFEAFPSPVPVFHLAMPIQHRGGCPDMHKNDIQINLERGSL